MSIVRGLFLVLFFASQANASLITNGGFDNCSPGIAFCLDGFDTFATEVNGNGDESFVVVDTPNDGVFFQIGTLTQPSFFVNTPAQGGGIRQEFAFTGGDLNIDINYNVLFDTSPFASNASRGAISATLFGPDANSMTQVLFNSESFFTASTPTLASVLNLTSDNLVAGFYTLQVAFTRAFQIGADNTLFGLTGISATSQNGGLAGGVVDVPEPRSVIIFLIASLGFLTMRKVRK